MSRVKQNFLDIRAFFHRDSKRPWLQKTCTRLLHSISIKDGRENHIVLP